MLTIRLPAVAGLFYPADSRQLALDYQNIYLDGLNEFPCTI